MRLNTLTTVFAFSALRLTAAYLLARYCFDFSARQAMFLVLFAACTLEAMRFRIWAAKRFEPFKIWVQPNYRRVLADLGFPDGPHEFASLLQYSHVTGDDLDNGVSCIVLSFDHDRGCHRVFWPDEKSYSSRIERRIAELDLDALPFASKFSAGCRKGNGALKARFGLRQVSEGICLFMRIDDEWWRNRWEQEETRPTFLSERPALWGDIEITLAVIPHTELQRFYNWYPLLPGVSESKRQAALGAVNATTCYGPTEFWMGFGLNTRYASVSHEQLDQGL